MFLLPMDEIMDYKQEFSTDDPGFGYCNLDGRISDLMDGQSSRRWGNG